MHGEISKDICVYPDFEILLSFRSILVNNSYLIRLKPIWGAIPKNNTLTHCFPFDCFLWIDIQECHRLLETLQCS